MQDSPEDGDEPDRRAKSSAWTSALAAHTVALIWATPVCLTAGWATSALTGGGWLTAPEPQWGAIAAAAAAGILTWTLTYRMIPGYIEELGEELREETGRPEGGTGPPQGGRNTTRAARKDQKRRTRVGQQRQSAGRAQSAAR